MTTPATEQALCLQQRGIHADVLSVQDIGHGRAVFLRVSPTAAAIACPLDTATLHIEETGRVPLLKARNAGEVSVAIIAHLVLAGGWQTRIVERTVVVPPGVTLEIPVKCVERGRWFSENSTSKWFRGVDRASLFMRMSLSSASSQSVERTGTYDLPQRGVWKLVDQELEEAHETTKTRSYEVIASKVRSRHRAVIDDAHLDIPPTSNAVLLLPAEGGAWLEALPSVDAFRLHASSLLSDLWQEARPRTGEKRRPMAAPEAVDWLLRRRCRPVTALPGSAGESFAFTGGVVAGDAVFLGGQLVHASFGCVELDVTA